MRNKIALSLLAVTVLTCSVAEAEHDILEFVKTLPNGWQEKGAPFDMEAFMFFIKENVGDRYPKHDHRSIVKHIFGRAPNETRQARTEWVYKGVFVDSVTETSWGVCRIWFNPEPPNNISCSFEEKKTD